MFQAQARWLLLAGISGSLLLACGDEADPGTPNNTAGSAGTSSTAGTSQGGSSSGSGGTSSTAGTMASSGSGGASAGTGTGGTAAGSGGSAAGSGGAGGGSGGASGGSGGSGGAAAPTAVANITGLGANEGKVTGTATFTQGATMTKLVLNLTACPDNSVHASHLHKVNDCGNNGEAALDHWSPNGEDLGNYKCEAGKATLEKEKPLAMWTVGDGGDTDVTKHSFMVHAAGDPTPGGRIGCGVVMKK